VFLFAIDTETVVVWVLGAIVLAIVLAIVAARDRKRKAAIGAVAAEIGFSNEGSKWSDAEQSRDLVTALFGAGKVRTFRNIMTGESSGLGAAVFDYSYIIGGGSDAHSHVQTCAAFLKRGAGLPTFALAPVGVMQKVGDALGQKGIRFDARPEFSQRYHLEASDEAKTRELFKPPVLALLEGLDAQKKWRIEGAGQTLIVYKAGKKIKPAEIRAFLDETGALASSLFSLVSTADSAKV
jgi:hypothetical protein